MDNFYLHKVFQDPEKVFDFSYKTFDEVKSTCIYVLDTNVLLVPFLTSKSGLDDIKKILQQLKKEARLIVPARVAREFAKNRGGSLAGIYRKVQEAIERLNKTDMNFGSFPILEESKEYQDAKKIEQTIQELFENYRENLNAIKDQIRKWNWNDPVSKIYKQIFTQEIILECSKKEKEIEEDLKFRIDHQIAPGYKDNNKIDNGIGDLIIWHTILELGKKKSADVTFISNEKKSDWFYNEFKTSLYPKYELFDEFRRETNGQSINIIGFEDFLSAQGAQKETINEIKEIYAPSGFAIIDRAKFLERLDHCISIANERSNGFLGSKFFVETHLAQGDFDIGNSWELYNQLEKEEIIETYKHLDPNGVYPSINAVRRKRKE